MKPIHFKEAHIELKKPQSMSNEECGSLWIHKTDDGQCISLWTVPFWQRVKFLFHGKLWLGVVSGQTQPPVWLDITKTIFKYKIPRDRPKPKPRTKGGKWHPCNDHPSQDDY